MFSSLPKLLLITILIHRGTLAATSITYSLWKHVTKCVRM